MLETEAWSRFFITHYQARQKRFGVPMLTLLCCLVTKNEFDIHKFNQQWFASKATLKNFGTLLEHHISSLWIFFTEKLIIINLENNYDQVAFIPPFPLLFIRTNMEGIGNKCDCMFPVQNVRWKRGQFLITMIKRKVLQGVPKKLTSRMLLEPRCTHRLNHQLMAPPVSVKTVFWSFLIKTKQK